MDKKLTLSYSQLEKLKTYLTADGQAYVQELWDRKVEKYNRRKNAKKKKELLKEKQYQGTLLERGDKFRKDLIKNQTPSETKFKAILKSLKVNYEFQKIFYFKNSFRVVDFYLPDYNSVIEIDGLSHNGKEDSDRRRTLQLLNSGISVVHRFTNKEVRDIPFCMNKLKKLLKIKEVTQRGRAGVAR